jgi:hypothetical protein
VALPPDICAFGDGSAIVPREKPIQLVSILRLEIRAIRMIRG